MRLAGETTDPPRTTEREPINITPEAKRLLKSLLWEPEMRGVGYSEFIIRAVREAAGEIMRAHEMEQGWYCEQCLARGVVNYADGEGAFEVVIRVEDAHQKTSPECPVPVCGLRVVNAEIVSETASLN